VNILRIYVFERLCWGCKFLYPTLGDSRVNLERALTLYKCKKKTFFDLLFAKAINTQKVIQDLSDTSVKWDVFKRYNSRVIRLIDMWRT